MRKVPPAPEGFPPATGPGSPALRPLCFYGRNWNSLPPFVGRDWIRARFHRTIGQVSKPALRSLSPGIRHFQRRRSTISAQKARKSPISSLPLQTPTANGSAGWLFQSHDQVRKREIKYGVPRIARLCGDVTGPGRSRPTVRSWRSWHLAEYFAGGRALEWPGDTRAMPEKIPGHGEAPLGLSPPILKPSPSLFSHDFFLPKSKFLLPGYPN
jgi:hypothetical protein